MTSPRDPRWLSVYGAAFVHEVATALKCAREGMTDDLVDRSIEEAEALADWEKERREARLMAEFIKAEQAAGDVKEQAK